MNKLAIVNSTLGSLKLKPGLETELADETLFGMLVNILEEDKDWLYVETDYFYKGYMHKDQLIIDNIKANKWDEDAKHIITWGIIDIMKEPKFSSYPIQTLTRGARIKLSGTKDDRWVEVIFPNGDRGWTRDNFIGTRTEIGTSYDEEILRNKVIDTAKLYLGTQYRWGGKSQLGIDCSGLSAISYLLNGVVIHRDASITEGFPVKEILREQLKPADLLFWKGHVAIYIGNDKYIHSTGASSGVVINSLNPKDDDYREDLVDIKQIGSIF